MDTSPPRPEILQAFNLSGKPIRISGGQGTCYQVGSAVLKPIENEEESNWIADLNAKLVNDAFSVPKYIRAEDGSWVVNGWVAYEFVEGKHKAGNYAEAIIISQEFHKALVGIPKPTFFEKRNNVWSVADRIAWGEQPFPDFSLTKDYFQNLSTLLTTNKLPDQIIHGDWGHGNILFDKDDKPVIIDFSPYWRPADFSIAIMIVDALAYEGADVSIVELCTNINDFNQLLLRALTRRICEYIGHQNHPENTQDRSKDIEIHLNTFNTIFQK